MWLIGYYEGKVIVAERFSAWWQCAVLQMGGLKTSAGLKQALDPSLQVTG